MRVYLVSSGNYWRMIGGEDGIRTHVPSYPDQLISSQRRYNRFGTSPFIGNKLPVCLIWIKRVIEFTYFKFQT